MRSVQIAIPEPCHENWQKMTPTDQGRFCSSCAKEVVDLSMMTDTEVLNYLSSLTYDKVCGRVLPSQLNRKITMPKDPKKRLFWYWNYIVMFFMFFSKSNIAKAQNKENVVAVPVMPQFCKTTLGTLVVPTGGIGVKRPSYRILTGKVVDKSNMPIPFASIHIKDLYLGVSADQDGFFSIKVMKNDYLEIAGAGFKSSILPIEDKKSVTIILERMDNSIRGEVVYVLGGFRPINQKYNAIFEVKDSETGLPLSKASFIVSNINNVRADSGFTDRDGIYKLVRNTKNDGYDVRILAEGYEASEFSISSKEFNERKEAWEVLLKKKTVTKPLPNTVRTSDVGQSTIRLGGIHVQGIDRSPIYVLDGIIIPDAKNIDPDDIENVTVLQPSAASAIYGAAGMYGAIVMISKSSVVTKMKTLDTVRIVAEQPRLIGKLTTYSTKTITRVIDSSENVKKNAIGDTKQGTALYIAVYPNPVNRGNLFTVALQLKEKGEHRIQITNGAGEVLLQKRVNAVNLSQKEMIQCDSRWSGGAYYISVFDNKDQLINRSSFIVQ